VAAYIRGEQNNAKGCIQLTGVTKVTGGLRGDVVEAAEWTLFAHQLPLHVLILTKTAVDASGLTQLILHFTDCTRCARGLER
jgi:hypothetical protein